MGKVILPLECSPICRNSWTVNRNKNIITLAILNDRNFPMGSKLQWIVSFFTNLKVLTTLFYCDLVVDQLPPFDEII